eukprot:m.73240 g.73240  ORF g.73240 m.73240 type:complete len:91 (+) comp35832_c0_seq1:2089-2361(+)
MSGAVQSGQRSAREVLHKIDPEWFAAIPEEPDQKPEILALVLRKWSWRVVKVTAVVAAAAGTCFVVWKINWARRHPAYFLFSLFSNWLIK